MKYRVVVDISPRVIEGTKSCHKYVFDEYRTKREASYISSEINRLGLGKASVERR